MSRSPTEERKTELYEQGWDAINRLIREDGSWSGRERNCFYLNSGDGRFIDVSGVSGLDFPEDGRAFAAFDLDGDGDLDLALKSRNQPQLRILRNDLANGRAAVRFRLQGRASNRDAVGARVELYTEKGLRQKTVRAVSGYLSQSSRNLHFGLEDLGEIEKAVIHWPSGHEQTLRPIPLNHAIRVVEGESGFEAKPFRPAVTTPVPPVEEPIEASSRGTWLLDPIPAPDFALQDLEGGTHRLSSFLGKKVLVNFWATWCAPCRGELLNFHEHRDELEDGGVRLLAISVDEPPAEEVVRSFARELGLDLPLLLATAEVVGVYNVLARHLFDRVADLAIPTSLLLDERGNIVKVYLGSVRAQEILSDSRRVPGSPEERLAAGLPFGGKNLGAKFLRNHFELANDFAERGYTKQAEAFYERAAVRSPSAAKIHFNLGTLRAREDRLEEAIMAFEMALAADADYADAYANLGSVYARQGKMTESVNSLEKALSLDPSLADAHNNLGNVYAALGRFPKALPAYRRAIQARPDFPEAHNNLGALQARLGKLPQAITSFQQAVALRPDYAEALLNLGNGLAQAGRAQQAVVPLRKAFELAPSPHSCVSLILACVEAGYTSEAQRILTEGLQRWKGNGDLEALATELGVKPAQ